VPESRQEALLLAIVLLLFGIQITLIGGGVIGFVLGLFALIVAAIRPTRSGS